MRRQSIAIIIGMFVIGIGLYLFLPIQEELPQHLEPYYQEDYSNEPFGEDYVVDENFQSHLPLVIVNTYGEAPKADSLWNSEESRYVAVEGDPYISGHIRIIDNGQELNQIKDEPCLESMLKIRLRGYSSLGYDKKQYFIKLVDEQGNKNEQDVLGMGTEWEWILNISLIDKSLLRNYICLNLASEVMPYVPDVSFCEVIFQDGEDYEYKGVYLLMESVKQGEDRVEIESYDPQDMYNSYILRRDRYNEKDIMLNTYGLEERLTLSYLELKYPKKEVKPDYIKLVEQEISDFEQALFADEEENYYKYLEFIDERSFVDYFIINEIFANYDAGYYSTYMYKNKGSKIHMGPVWDFDGALDNYLRESLKIDSTAMHDATWFRQLLRDKNFVDHLIKRYKELRKNVLSDEYIISYIDSAADYLGQAKVRDWDRWGYFYTDDYLNLNQEGQNRNTKSYEEEIDKIKFIITSHGAWLDEHIDSLYQFSEFSREEKAEGYLDKIAYFLFGDQKHDLFMNTMGAIFIGIFIISIILVQRE